MYQMILKAWQDGGAAMEALEGDSDAASTSTYPVYWFAPVAQILAFAALFLAVFSPLFS